MPVQLGARGQHGFDEPLGLLSDCHRRIENFLAVLQKVVDQVQGHDLNAEQRAAVETAMTYFGTAAPRHTADEEESLFPQLRATERPDVQAALEVVRKLEQEHAAADAAHAEVEFWYRRWLSAGPLAVPQVRKLSQVLKSLRELYRRHIEVEDSEIFPLAGAVLSREQLSQIGHQMAERRGLTIAM